MHDTRHPPVYLPVPLLGNFGGRQGAYLVHHLPRRAPRSPYSLAPAAHTHGDREGCRFITELIPAWVWFAIPASTYAQTPWTRRSDGGRSFETRLTPLWAGLRNIHQFSLYLLRFRRLVLSPFTYGQQGPFPCCGYGMLGVYDAHVVPIPISLFFSFCDLLGNCSPSVVLKVLVLVASQLFINIHMT